MTDSTISITPVVDTASSDGDGDAKLNIATYSNPYIKWGSSYIEVYNTDGTTINRNEKIVIFYNIIDEISFISEQNMIEINADDVLIHLVYSEYSNAEFYYKYLDYVLSNTEKI